MSFSKQFSEHTGQFIDDMDDNKYDASVLMLTNVMWDAQLHYPANAFSSMLDWIIETIDYFMTDQTLSLL